MSSSKAISVELSTTKHSLSALQDLSNRDLWSSAVVANAGRRKATARLVAHLAEIDRRELVYDEGYSSMYDFCVRGLGMSEGTAYRSIAGARAARSFPVVLSLLADGNLHLSGLSLLAPRLTEENHAALLEDASGKTSAGIRVLLARWFSKPDVPDRVEPSAGKGPRAGVEPLSEGRFEVHFSAGESLKAKLEHAQDALTLMSKVFGPPPGTYDGPIPTEIDAREGLHDGATLAWRDLSADEAILGGRRIKLQRWLGPALIDACYGFDPLVDPADSDLAPNGRIRARVWRDRVLLLELRPRETWNGGISHVAVVDAASGRLIGHFAGTCWGSRGFPLPWQPVGPRVLDMDLREGPPPVW